MLLIDRIAGKYTASLGTIIRRNGSANFIACLSISHNWVRDGDKISPLPSDAPVFVQEALAGSNSTDLTFPTILGLIRGGIEGIEISVDPKVFEKANRLSLGMSLSSEIPGLVAKLYPYQDHGVAWMHEALDSTNGVILADEMGLGKTLQIIALFLLKKLTNEAPALIVCPTTLIANWCREITTKSP